MKQKAKSIIINAINMKFILIITLSILVSKMAQSQERLFFKNYGMAYDFLARNMPHVNDSFNSKKSICQVIFDITNDGSVINPKVVFQDEPNIDSIIIKAVNASDKLWKFLVNSKKNKTVVLTVILVAGEIEGRNNIIEKQKKEIMIDNCIILRPLVLFWYNSYK